MVGGFLDRKWDSHHQNVSVDPRSPAVRNQMRQKAGEIQAFRAFERRAEKWCKEPIPRIETDPISEEGKNLPDDIDRWRDPASLLKECYQSRKGERIHEDGSFMHHQKGPITATYTADWFLRRENTGGNWGNG